MREGVAMQGVTVRDSLLRECKVAAVNAALYVKSPCCCFPLLRDSALFSCRVAMDISTDSQGMWSMRMQRSKRSMRMR